ncbi:hypothetical protein QN277_010780 [Acacia crassicarpa]|uniref:Uncharacterized protein n=1 Tax=Acacia crassicarpa TaxID=499986 RepID=A0AAE1IPX8_9FABA|nr:hypothetical protein QN277_010780 [Acacia crassicarpa]
MPESEPVVGLSWQPKLPIPSSSYSKAVNISQNKSQPDATSSAIWKPRSELVDGLFVQFSDAKKLNKLVRKQVKDTTGKNWGAEQRRA